MNRFKNIEDENFYPQIYIPSFEQVVNLGLANGRTKPNSDLPVIVIFYGDDSLDEFPGYTLNEEGDFVELGFLVDEPYAEENEVWVISLNESVNNDGEMTDEQDSNTRVSISNGRVLASPSATIDNMLVLCHKESFAAGKSEVNMLTIFSNWGFSKQELEKYDKGRYEGGRIKKVERDDISSDPNEATLLNPNFLVLNDWNDRAPGEPYANYIIFEYDSWPTGIKTATFYHNVAEKTKKYRSANVYYDSRTMHQSEFNGPASQNSCLIWSGRYQ